MRKQHPASFFPLSAEKLQKGVQATFKCDKCTPTVTDEERNKD